MTKNSTTDSRLSALVGRWLLVAGIAGAPLAIGALHLVTLYIATFVIATATTLSWWDAPPVKTRGIATVLLATGIGLIIYTALQCVPIPLRGLALLAPRNADSWSRALVPLGASPPRWVPLTLDPVATRVEFLRGVTYLLTFVAALRIAHRRQGAVTLSLAIVGTGVVLAVAAFLHPELGAHRVFGVYAPRIWRSQRHLAPLLNPNHLGAYLNIAFCLALGALATSAPPMPRPILAVILLLLGATQVWVASRAGTACMVAGILIVGALELAHRRGRSDPIATTAVVSGVIALAAVAMMALVSDDDVSRELLTTDLSKFNVLSDVATMARAHALFGVGRGAFESTFPAFRQGTTHIVFTHPENLMGQWSTEWGIPVALTALVAVAIALRPKAALDRSRLAIGAWAALATLGIQNIADFSSEVPGIMIAASTCAAIIVGGSAGRPSRWRVGLWCQKPRIVAVAAGALACTAMLLAARCFGNELEDEKDRIQAAVFDPSESAPAMRALEHAAMLRHPAEPYFPYAAALRATLRGDENPLPWLEATLERALVYGPAHFLLARYLRKRSPSQARLEYRLATEQIPEATDDIEAEAPSLVGSFEDAIELVPSGAPGLHVLEALVERLAPRLPATAVLLDAELVAREPRLVGPALRRARAAVDDLEGIPAPWCSGAAAWAACLRTASDSVKAAQQIAPAQCEPYELEARARIAGGEMSSAIKDFAQQAEGTKDRVSCLSQVAVLAIGRDRERAEATLDEIARAGCSDDAECAQRLFWVAQQEEAMKSRVRALALYKEAHERSPDNDTTLGRIAGIAAELGLHVEAAEDYTQLARRHPSESSYARAADAEREAMHSAR